MHKIMYKLRQKINNAINYAGHQLLVKKPIDTFCSYTGPKKI